MFVAVDGFVGLVEFEVGAGGVEEQQVHFQVQQVGDVVIHRARQLWGYLDQPVHRPIAGLIDHGVQPVDHDVVFDPAGRGQLRGRRQRPVGDQREQDPLDPLVQPAPGEHPPYRRVDPKPAPQPVQHERPAQRTRLGERQPGRAATSHTSQRLGRVQQPGQRPDQPADALHVDGVLPAEGVQHLRPRHTRGSVPLVVGQLQIPDDLTVPGLPRRGLHIHGLDDIRDTAGRTAIIRKNVSLGKSTVSASAQHADLQLHPLRRPEPAHNCGTQARRSTRKNPRFTRWPSSGKGHPTSGSNSPVSATSPTSAPSARWPAPSSTRTSD